MDHINENLSSLQSYSRNSKSQATSFRDNSDAKKRYHIVNLHERQMERQKVKQKEEDKRREQRRKQKKRILGQLQRKKRELQQLQKMHKSQSKELNQEGRAKIDAKIKQKQDKEKQIQKLILQKNNQQIAKTRQKEALKRLQNQRIEKNLKQIQAKHLRKTHCRTQQNQRVQAGRFSKSMEQREMDRMRQSVLMREKEKQNLIRGLSQYGLQEKRGGSCSTLGVIIVSRQNQEENEAFKRAEEEQERQKLVQEQKKKLVQINRMKAVERGKEALARTQKQQEYDNYCQEVAREQVKYNLKRVQAGRQNQFTGVKPLTLSQIEANKKIRGEQQFERLFFKGRKLEKNTKLVSKFTTFEGKMKEIPPVKTIVKPQKKKINYMDQESLVPQVSEGHFSFEEQRDWQARKGEKTEEMNVGTEVELKPIIRQTRIEDTKANNMIQTRAPGSKKKAQLNYSQSEEDSIQ